MAVTKIKAIRGAVNKALDYIMNPEKTDEKLFVTGYGCDPTTAAKEFEFIRRVAAKKNGTAVRTMILYNERN